MKTINNIIEAIVVLIVLPFILAFKLLGLFMILLFLSSPIWIFALIVWLIAR